MANQVVKPRTSGWAKLRWGILGMDCLLLALNYGDRAMIGVAAPHIIEEFHFSSAVWGIIISAFAFGYAPFCFIGGWTSDKLGPRKVMGWAAIWWSIFTGLTAVGFNFVSFVILRFLFGFGEGPQASTMAKLVSNWFPQRETATSVGIAQAATPLGGALATPLVVWLMAITNGSWRFPFIVLGIIGILFALGWFLVVRDKPENHPWITAKELAEIQSGELARRPEFESDGTTRPISFYLKKPIVWSTALAFFGYNWVLFVFTGWFPTYLVQAHNINIKSLAIGATIPWIAGTVGVILGGVITDRIAKKTGNPAKARKWLMVICLIGVGVSFVPAALVTSITGAVSLMAISMFLNYLTCAQYFAIISDTVPSSRLGGVMGMVHFIAVTAGILGPFVTGWLVTLTNSWVSGFAVCGIIVIAGAICMAIFGKSDSRENLIERGNKHITELSN
ncbi:MFS transporter [Neobacillus cucumis]|uniref:MFS transporter n=1 Tax=Neobacillus cucumis TaxID=1740721 RepID=UPI00203C6926|nr:MFS transporter [Neobacillus cucumis]MCM3728162.1 MFS transporter [Neobacillus cucumis]